jgi:hypothetical protein
LKRFPRLTLPEAAALAEALALCTAASIILRAVRFSRVAPRLGRHMVESPPHRQGVSAGDIRRLRWAVATAARILPWKPVCLPQAVTAQWMLRRRGIPSTLYLGTDPASGYHAHAWVRVGEVIMTGGDDPRRYTVVSTFS